MTGSFGGRGDTLCLGGDGVGRIDHRDARDRLDQGAKKREVGASENDSISAVGASPGHLLTNNVLVRDLAALDGFNPRWARPRQNFHTRGKPRDHGVEEDALEGGRRGEDGDGSRSRCLSCRFHGGLHSDNG